MLLSINITTLLWSFVLVPIVMNWKIYVRNKDSNKKIEVELLEYFRLLCQTHLTFLVMFFLMKREKWKK